MKYLLNKLKITVYLPVVTLFLLLGFTPIQQNVHAANMDHDMNNMSREANRCAGSSASSTEVLKKEQQIPDKDEDEDPKPPEQDSYYVQFYQFSEPEKPGNAYTLGAGIFRPPDLVKLYANFRF